MSVLLLFCTASFAAGPTTAPSASYDWNQWSKFWSFQLVVKREPPAVSDPHWSANPIDRFIFAKLQSNGLTPAPEADRSTLIRRATFDLLGLPPTASEIRTFVGDPSPDAYDKLLDRLLASPHYGERYGRHWLDLARYIPGRITFPGIAHTSGDQAYRDYVVRALNCDKPYNQFITEQLAGDLLPVAQDHQQEFDQIAAPAFLSIGSWFDECTDPNRLRMEIIDDQISTTSQTFLGLTVGCARCHDHKFDPIPTADYYALAGVFGSTKVIGQLNDYWRDGRTRLLRPLAMPDEVAADNRIVAQIDQAKTQRWQLLTDARTKLVAQWTAREADYLAAAAQEGAPFVKTLRAENFDGEHNLKISQLSRDGIGVNVLEAMTPLDEWAKYDITVPKDGQYVLEALYSTDEQTPLLVQMNGQTVSKNALDQGTGGWDLKFQRWQEVARFPMRAGLNFLRMTASQGNFPRLDRLRLWSDDPGATGQIESLAGARRLDPVILARFVRAPEDPWPTIAGIEPFCDGNQRQVLAAIDSQIAQLEASRHPSELVISVADQASPADCPIHVRGDVYDVSPDGVPRGAPRLLDMALPRPTIAPDHSGRLELANWIVDPRNPLTARVMVNRLWQWHFGRGIVASTSDFGSRGDPPTHPELLDWLAATFVEQGWSIKQLNKLIMTSAVYRLSSEGSDPLAAKTDPDDKLLSVFRRRRLDAEELYDAMLASANLVQPQPNGQPLNVEKSKNRAMYVLASNRAPKGLGPDIRKMFPLFDYDPSGAPIALRPTSTTAAQSLFWLNSPVPSYYAGRFAERLLKMDKLDDRKRVEMAYLIAIGHTPDTDLLDATVAYIQNQVTAGASRQDAWVQLCQAIYASDEFHYVD